MGLVGADADGYEEVNGGFGRLNIGIETWKVAQYWSLVKLNGWLWG